MKLLVFRRHLVPFWVSHVQDCEMSLRAVAYRLLQNGRLLLRQFRTERISKDVVDGVSSTILPRGIAVESSVNSASVVRNVQQHARRLFIDNVLKRVTNSLAADLRRRAAKRLLFGDSAPFLAFVGVSLASGTGIITKEDELEGICWEIREAVSRMEWSFIREESDLLNVVSRSVSLNNFAVGKAIAKGSNAVVYAAKPKQANLRDGNNENENTTHDSTEDDSSFPLAIKMMFNYDAESNASSILTAMQRETVPAMNYFSNEETQSWEESLIHRRRTLPPHPNIVQMYCVFADRVPALPGSLTLYPDALPARINPEGYGRNMSLFLVMKRYCTSLKQYLSDGTPNPRVSLLLLTQLLEAVTHMVVHGIAHRDLKADNILLDMSEGDEVCPSLVVTDFGCCLADRVFGLTLPHNSPYTDKGGNTALMAPEVLCAEPGPFSSISYSKADVWAVGTLAYEIYGSSNPFYVTTGNKNDKASSLCKSSYNDADLPSLPESVPSIIAQLITEMLARNPSKRVSAELAATVCQLILWAPSTWLQRSECQKLPSSAEILQWLLCLTTKVLCEGRRITVQKSSPEDINADFHNAGTKLSETLPDHHGGRRTLPEYQLIASFLRRIKLTQVRCALRWIQSA